VRNGFRVVEPYHVEPSLNGVTAQAGIVHLEPKVMDARVGVPRRACRRGSRS
jgi:hypothetical protein